MINPQKPVINLITNCNRFTALLNTYIYLGRQAIIITQPHPPTCTDMSLEMSVHIMLMSDHIHMKPVSSLLLVITTHTNSYLQMWFPTHHQLHRVYLNRDAF